MISKYQKSAYVSFSKHDVDKDGLEDKIVIQHDASGKKTSCEYTIANKTYTAEFHHNNYCYPESEEEKAIFKKLPIVIAYDSTNAKISRVLISLELMREFNYALDDSLKSQYEKFFFKCQ